MYRDNITLDDLLYLSDGAECCICGDDYLLRVDPAGGGIFCEACYGALTRLESDPMRARLLADYLAD